MYGKTLSISGKLSVMTVLVLASGGLAFAANGYSYSTSPGQQGSGYNSQGSHTNRYQNQQQLRSGRQDTPYTYFGNQGRNSYQNHSNQGLQDQQRYRSRSNMNNQYNRSNQYSQQYSNRGGNMNRYGQGYDRGSYQGSYRGYGQSGNGYRHNQHRGQGQQLEPRSHPNYPYD